MKALFSLAALLSLTAQAAIFGVDDRLSVTSNTIFAAAGKSVAVAVLSANVEKSGPGKLRLLVESMTNLCPGEKFAGELSLGYACTGFLIAPDLLVTAGHCMVNTGETRHETKMHCEAFHWLFDYQRPASGKMDYENIPEKNLYRCKEIVYAVKEERAPFRDYALVRLDRATTGRTPFKLATLKAGERVSMLGHPLGMTLKRSAAAPVLLNNPARQSFITALDAFEGNSGSPVFNPQNEVVGILVGGTPSYGMIPARNRSCEVYNRCSEAGTQCTQFDADTSVFPEFQRVGSEVQRIAPIQGLLK